jgi:hypothetical protein
MEPADAAAGSCPEPIDERNQCRMRLKLSERELHGPALSYIARVAQVKGPVRNPPMLHRDDLRSRKRRLEQALVLL